MTFESQLVLILYFSILCNSFALWTSGSQSSRGHKFSIACGGNIEKSVPFSLSSNTFYVDKELPSNQEEFYRGSEICFEGSSSNHVLLKWDNKPKRTLFVAKPDPDILPDVREALLLLREKNLDVVVESSLIDTLKENYSNETVLLNDLILFSEEDSSIDFVIGFGGDGLLLHCCSLFQNRSIPPCMCFNFGSLGFLSPFQCDEFPSQVEKVLSGTVMLTLRMRLRCSIIRDGVELETHCVLNEAVIDRGPSPYLSVIDVNCDSNRLTTLQGDGIIVATPTGSTAYSLAAGGSIVYPSVPAILLTPICAHSLSFRPVLLPDSSVLSCEIPHDSRSTGWASFDGKHRKELKRGDKLVVRLSPFPLPTINKKAYTGDWFDSLEAGFMFNLRPRQKAKNW